MDHDPLLGELPLQYAVALRLRAVGASDRTIADALDVDAAAIETLVELANQKYRALHRRAAKPGAAHRVETGGL